jgi:uncharacterized protein (DUF58 family)
MDYARSRDGAAGVTKFQYARLLAASIAHLVSRQGDAVGLVTYADGIRQFLPSRGGQAHLRSLLLALNRTEASGRTQGAAALSRTIELLKRRGLLVLISDLYDERDDEYSDRVTCKFCGGDFYWGETDRGWRLHDYETGELHDCPKYHGR